MHSGKLSLGLIVSFLFVFVYQPQAWAQNLHRDVISKTKSRTFIKEVDLKSKQLTQNIQSKAKTSKRASRQQVSSKLAMEVDDLSSKHENSEKVTTPTNNTDAEVEKFDNIDENNKKERTFPFITNFISNLMNRRTCTYPCTLEAFQEEQCCPPEILPVPVPISPQHCSSCNSPPFPQQFQPNFLPQLPGRLPNHLQYPSINLPRAPQHIGFPYAPQFSPPFHGQFPQAFSCCAVCTQYNFYGPPPCQYFGRSMA